MAVFDNLRNFIRQGKQAGSKNTHASESSLPSASDKVSPKAGHTKGSIQGNAIFSENEGVSTDHPGKGTSRQPGPPVCESQAVKAKNVDSPAKGKANKYDIAVKQIIAEENLTRSKIPSYPGLENYQLISKMGDGAFSIVYRAKVVTDNIPMGLRANEPRAIKIVSRKNLTASQRRSVLKEASIMRQLDHGCIVHMFDFIETPDHYFIVLELVEGGELFHQIVHLTYFSENLSRHVIVQVANAVRYLHEEAGVVHRDIKPENLLFSRIPLIPSKTKILRPGDDESKEDEGEFQENVGGGCVGTIKLADFGLSKIIWDEKTMTPCGTVGYTAPEIVKDEKYSKSVDMWALGCVLYTILCGFPPFYDESIEMLTQKVALGQYTFLSPWWDGISESAKDLVSRLLTVDPEKRYTIDEFLQHPWITQAEMRLPMSSEVAEHMIASSIPSTPIHEHGARDVARNGAIKDAFDVSNAVYRLEQEISRRNQRTLQKPAILEEGEEDDTDFAHIENAFEKLNLRGSRSLNAAQPGSNAAGLRTNRNELPSVGSSRAATKRAVAASGMNGGVPSKFFDLHLEGSTLLERRKARQTPVAH